jgi:hypothetical protein
MDLIAFLFYRAGLNPYNLPNIISVELSSAHTSYQTQPKNTQLYVVSLAQLSLSKVE